MNAAYLDSFGLPGTRQNDGSLDMGDSAAIYFNILALDPKEDDTKATLYVKNVPVRHPDDRYWWGQTDRFSRDQLIPMLCYGIKRDLASSFPGTVSISKTFYAHEKKAFCLAWNTKGNGEISMPTKFPDITGPEIWGLWLRTYKPPGYKLLLPFCDLETLVNALLWRFYQPLTNQITRNHMLVCITQRTDPSIVSKLADKINNYADLVARWEAHCIVTGEYPTQDLFKNALK